MMEIFSEFGKIKEQDPEGEAAVGLAKRLQEFITEHFYTCTERYCWVLEQCMRAAVI